MHCGPWWPAKPENLMSPAIQIQDGQAILEVVYNITLNGRSVESDSNRFTEVIGGSRGDLTEAEARVNVTGAARAFVTNTLMGLGEGYEVSCWDDAGCFYS